MASTLETDVAAHYARPDLLETILAGVAAAGGDPTAPTIDDLAPVDEFHTAGRLTTLRALEMLPLVRGMHVLDAGSGIGGTARALATEAGVRVTGVDLTPEYVEVARALSERMGLAGVCRFEVASVTELPFPDAAFDAGVSMHVAMNVPDRAGFYAELARTLKPGALLLFFDVMKGPGAGMVYPVPWAETEATSFLCSPAETAALVSAAGFTVTRQESFRDFAMDYFREAFAKAADADGPPPVGLHLLTGANAPEKFSNYAQALDAHQIDPVMLLAERS